MAAWLHRWLLACGLGLAAGAQASPAVELADGVLWLRGGFEPGRQPDGNSLLLRGTDGWLLVDSGRHPAHAERILDVVAGSGLPLAAIVNSHWHLDHVSNNPRLRAAHPALEVHASRAIDAALDGFLADYRRQLMQTLADPSQGSAQQRADWQAELARIDQGAALRPDHPVDVAQPRTIGGREVELGLAVDAVTAGDVWLFDPASGVLAAGDLVTLPVPFLDTACPSRWRAALDALERVPFRQLLPGHGAPLDRDGFALWRRAFGRLLDCADGSQPAIACIDGWLGDAAPLLDGADPQLTRNLLEYYVGQRLRGADAGHGCPATAVSEDRRRQPPR